MQAIILAAGMGKRLGHLTQDNTKCMVKVNGVTLIERLLHQLDDLGSHKLSKIVIVTGYKGDKLRKYISELDIHTPVEYVDNPIYASTNNIYSLWLAKDYLLSDDTLLFESDLIFDIAIIQKLLQHPYPSLCLVSKYESWMDGTVIKIGQGGEIDKFIPGTEFRYEEADSYYKTVNVYKFSQQFSSTHYVPFLEAYCKALGNNEYYEQVLRVITLLNKPEIKDLPLNGEPWYEIDDIQDLDIAESIFCKDSEKYARIASRIGGYWRYPKMLDFTTPANPYFPNERLKSELKSNFDRLICAPPSSVSVSNLLAGKYQGIPQDQVLACNNIADAVHKYLSQNNSRLICTPPANHSSLSELSNATIAYASEQTAENIIKELGDRQLDYLYISRPNHILGTNLGKEEILKLSNWANEKGFHLIIDETFLDLSAERPEGTLIEQVVLQNHPSLIVIKSLSESHGLPGFSMGILATGDHVWKADFEKSISGSCINSLVEFYLQIVGKYEKQYLYSCRQYQEERNRVAEAINQTGVLRITPSNGVVLICEAVSPYNVCDVAESLLIKNQILVKKAPSDFGAKIILSIKSPKENNLLIKALSALTA